MERLQAMKTGALIRFACEAGAILGRAAPDERRALIVYGERLGAAFQIADDLLDTHGDATVMGKAARKDAGKATLVAALGPRAAKERLAALESGGDCRPRPVRSTRRRVAGGGAVRGAASQITLKPPPRSWRRRSAGAPG